DETSIDTGGRRSGFIDLGIDEISSGGDQAGSLVFSNIEETPVAPDIEELESRVADNPDDPEAHQALGEALQSRRSGSASGAGRSADRAGRPGAGDRRARSRDGRLRECGQSLARARPRR